MYYVLMYTFHSLFKAIVINAVIHILYLITLDEREVDEMRLWVYGTPPRVLAVLVAGDCCWLGRKQHCYS
jgi:hypothetical protein